MCLTFLKFLRRKYKCVFKSRVYNFGILGFDFWRLLNYSIFFFTECRAWWLCSSSWREYESDITKDVEDASQYAHQVGSYAVRIWLWGFGFWIHASKAVLVRSHHSVHCRQRLRQICRIYNKFTKVSASTAFQASCYLYQISRKTVHHWHVDCFCHTSHWFSCGTCCIFHR